MNEKISAAPIGRTRHLGDNVFLALIAAALVLFICDTWTPVEQMDDAYISFQYARNWVAGHGLVFNIGERVEGYTNLLWTLLIGLGMKLGLAAPVVCRWLSFASGAGLLIMSAVYAAALLPRGARWLAGLAPLVLLASNAFACWIAAGLETPLFALLITLALYASLRKQIYLVVCWCALATLTRPEGAVYAATLLGLDWLLTIYQLPRRNPRALFATLYPMFAFAGFIALYTAWRWSYYGELLPNTFYAKTGGIPLSHGFKYIANFGVDGPGLLVIPVLLGAYICRAYRGAFIAIAVTVCYAISIGGDAFRLGRFLLPVFPALIAGALLGIHWAYGKKRAVGIAMASLLPLTVIWSLYGPPLGTDFYKLPSKPFPQLAKRADAKNHAGFGGIRATQKILRDLTALSPPVKQVACIGIGQLAFFSSGIYVLDLVGLVDKHIARSKKTVDGDVLLLPGHQRTDSDYILARSPDVIIIPRKDAQLPINLPAVYDLWHNPQLEQRYEWDEKIEAYRLRAEFRSERELLLE
jgi:arabinofuranosyltransferase